MKFKYTAVLPLFALFSFFTNPSEAQQGDFSIGAGFSKQPNKNNYKVSLEGECFWKIEKEKDIHWGVYLSAPLINKSNYWGSGGFAVKKGLRRESQLVFKAGPLVSNKAESGLKAAVGIKVPYRKGRTGFESGIERLSNGDCYYTFGINYSF